MARNTLHFTATAPLCRAGRGDGENDPTGRINAGYLQRSIFNPQHFVHHPQTPRIAMLFTTNPLLHLVALAAVLSARMASDDRRAQRRRGHLQWRGTVIEHPPRSALRFSAFVNRSFRRRIDRGRLCRRSNALVLRDGDSPRGHRSPEMLLNSQFGGDVVLLAESFLSCVPHPTKLLPA
ncbi:hypothetical protein DFH09DRAFT_260872 [Mycena vulgaris]|nr:hypothetical protein DFH09DRAFT_260872 [Mycena vulgaris]